MCDDRTLYTKIKKPNEVTTSAQFRHTACMLLKLFPNLTLEPLSE
jgi:hypothetical protein